jgi:predicted chitinase
VTYALTWLPEVLENAGLKVAETTDWRTRGRGDITAVKGVICHHTATVAPGNMPTLNTLINGRSDLSGPLCQLGLGRDGTFYVVAAGKAHHAGTGDWHGITQNMGNEQTIGIEAENSGLDNDPWPDVQMDAYRRGVAAILTYIGAGPQMVCGHKEYAPGRKDDPSLDMALFRTEVGRLMAGQAAPPPIASIDSTGRATLRRGMRGDAVAALQKQLGIAADGVFGPGTESALRVWQNHHGLVGDGIAGPCTLAMLDSEPRTAALIPVAHAAPDAGVPAQIDTALLRIAFPLNTADQLALWVTPLHDACARYDIATPFSLSGFLANISAESRDLTRLSENLNYSVQGLLDTFGPNRISPDDAKRLGRKPDEGALPVERMRAIANLVYGGAWGRANLGNTDPDDGWTFRGYGPIQITGRGNFSGFATAVGIAPEDAPAIVRTPAGGALSAAWFWNSRDLNTIAAKDDIAAMRAAVNPARLGLQTTTACYARLKAELARRGV